MLFNKEVLMADTIDSEKYQTDFVNGFNDFAPRLYNLDADCETPCPWACPWHWDEGFEYEAESAYEAGSMHAEKYYEEIDKLIRQDLAERNILVFESDMYCSAVEDLEAYFNSEPYNEAGIDEDGYYSIFNAFDKLGIEYSVEYDGHGNIDLVTVNMNTAIH